MNITIKHVPIFPDNPLNPAKCNIKTGVITLNDSVWNKLTPIEQRYWLAHEEGHIRTHGGSEVEADTYAFKKVAGSQPYSLRDIRRSMHKVIATNPNAPEAQDRLESNKLLSLNLAANRGSQSAKQLLTKIPNSMATPIKTTTALMSVNNVNLAKAKNVAAQLTTTAKNATTTTTKTTPTSSLTPTLAQIKPTPLVGTPPVTISSKSTSQPTTLTPRVNGSIVPNRTILPVPTGNVVFTETIAKPIVIANATAVGTQTATETSQGGVVDPTQPVIMQENPAQVEGGAEEQQNRHQAPAKETVEDKPTVEQPQTKVKKEDKNKNLSYIIVALAVIAVGYFIYKSKKK